MSVNTEAIQGELDKGFNVICATCKHHWAGKEKGLDNCGDETCKGPAKKGDFPNYSGPISREKFPAFCLCCLNPKLHLQLVVNGKRAFGLCYKHRRNFEFLKTGDALQSVSPLVIPV